MEDVLLGCAIVLAGFTQGVAGFGFGMVAMSVAPLVYPPRVAVPIIAVCALLVCSALLFESRRHIDFRKIGPPAAGALVGTPIGVEFLRTADTHLVIAALGVLIVLYSLWGMRGLWRDRAPPPVAASGGAPRFGWGALAGLLSGALGGAFNVGGPPVVFYAAASRWEAGAVRATLQAFFLLTTVYSIALYSVRGLLPADVLGRALWLLPLVAVGVGAGALVGRRVNGRAFRWTLFAVLLALGVNFVVRSV